MNAHVMSRSLFAGLMSISLASVGVGAAGDARADCVSFSGLFSLGKGCTTTQFGDLAIGLGSYVSATASGGLNVAIAIGSGRSASELIAYAVGVGNVATSIGVETGATAQGYFNTAVAAGIPGYNLGAPTYGLVAGTWDTVAEADGILNAAYSFGAGNIAFAGNGYPFNSEPLGVNLAITVGNGSNSYAGYAPTILQFSAALGNNKVADGGINNTNGGRPAAASGRSVERRVRTGAVSTKSDSSAAPHQSTGHRRARTR
ncbi:hypothetical protein FHT40_001021 [Mycolicibacterium sp. BK556]|uniref:hypothetical protein n=1 Tax=unclassified Mycolicibacterium TaxID=2636767 RepID=UPI0016139FDA|nr:MULTISPECIES: hypothetical protein [unclassified Mycolicibacterium]MBB3601388.1 hypothetical protein [Mycolicibacterium sp. BK556]MBB3631140.1 hypothetical protein [Mycolicibacterium sp. BK607]